MPDQTLPARPTPTLNYENIGHFRATYLVTGTGTADLPPITLSIRSAGFHLQEYLTADEAYRLSDALKIMALRVRGES